MRRLIEMTDYNHTKSRKVVIRELTITGVFIALTIVFTAFVNIKLPFGYGGLIHLGNIPLMLAAFLYGKRTGFFAGAFGMAIFDLLSSWAIYAPCTFITCGLMGLVAGYLTERYTGYGAKILAVGIMLLIKLSGYYIFEAIFYHNLIEPLASIPGNTLQILCAAIPVLIVIHPLEQALRKLSFIQKKVDNTEK